MNIRHLVCALLAGASTWALAQGTPPPASPAKKELVAKLLQQQQPGFEGLARGLVERPAAQLMQQAAPVLQTQVPADKREAVGKGIEADVRKYVDDTVPLVRERAVKLAPSTIGAALEEKFTEDELRQLVAWFESPVNKKFQQAFPEIQNSYMQKLVADTQPVVEPRLRALEQKMRASLGLPAAPAGADAGAPKAASKPAAKPPARPASR